MAISKTRYVLITSGVGGQAAVGRRELIARVFTNNILVPTQGVLEFGGGATAALLNVGNYFGTTSNEYKFASKYFGFISKDARQADKISFARYMTEATPAQVISTQSSPLGQLQQVNNGALALSMGGLTQTITGFNGSTMTAFADVATWLQNAINSVDNAPVEWKNATVTYTNSRFVLSSGSTGAGVIVIEPTTEDTDIAPLIGWSSETNPVVSDGTTKQTVTDILANNANISDNFGSFTFLDQLSTDQITEVANWVNAQNVSYVYSERVTTDNVNAVQEAVKGMNGVCLTLDTSNSYAQYMPMAIGACINYERPNAATNFMFNQFAGEVASITTDGDADAYDRIKINYLGATQQAGKNISFYQRGILQGDISDIGVYWNEMWLKDAFTTEFLNLLLALKMLPANDSGANTARGVMIPVIEDAKNNGVIQPGKSLTSIQKAYITSLTNDEDAWRSVEQNGWYLDVTVSSYVNANNGLTEYRIDYQLIYGKGDSIKQVVGTDILI